MNFNYLLIFIPLITIYIIGFFFPINTSDYNEKQIIFKPPSYVFAIVWPILLILIGLSWFINKNLTYFYIILTFLLSFWILIYNYSKILGFIDILLTILFILYLIIQKIENKNKNIINIKNLNISSILLMPLVLWLSFASYLNYNSI